MKGNMAKIKKDWGEEERDAVRQAVESTRERLKKAPFSLANFYQDIFREFTLQQPLGAWRTSIGSVTASLPFYRTIVVPIDPVRNVENDLGISVQQLIELFKNGFVLPVITTHSDYYTSGVTKPLFELRGVYHVPSIERFWGAYLTLRGLEKEDVDELIRATHSQVRDKYGSDEEIGAKLSVAFSHATKKAYGLTEPAFGGLVQAQFKRIIETLKIFGFSRLVEVTLGKTGDVEIAFRVFSVLCRLLCEPYYSSFGGYVNYEYKDMEELKRTTAYPPATDKAIVLPHDLLAEFTDSYFYEVPLKIEDPLRFAYRVRRESSVEENFKILKTFADDLGKGKFRDAIDRVKSSRDVIEELNARICEIQKSYERTKNILKIGSVLAPSSSSLPLGIQALSQGDIRFVFGWLGIVATNVLLNCYDEKLSTLITDLRFKRIGTPYLIWRRKKR